MKFAVGIALAGLVSMNAIADDASLIANFKKANQTYKGAMGKNFLQGVRGRSPVGEAGAVGCYKLGSGGAGLFQAAFRNLIGQELVNKDQFYLGNLYTTNYYELMGEYVYGDACGNHPIDNRAMLNIGAAAMPKMMTMTRHAVLERYYSETFPSTRIGSARTIRGISDLENENTFARYYFNFGLSAMDQDLQYLPLYLLSKKSPLKTSSVLGKARDAIANMYLSRTGSDGAAGQGYAGDLYKLRNMIHNTLSKDTIAEIEKFKRKYPSDAAELNVIQGYLRAYFATGAADVLSAAKKVNDAEVVAAAQPLVKGPSDAASLLALSKALVSVRNNVSDETKFPTDAKVDVLILLNVGAQYLAKEVTAMKVIEHKEALGVILNAIYLEGFLVKPNYEFFAKQMEAQDLATAAATLGKVVAVASKTIEKAFSPALEQWKTVEPKMENFLDNVIKSSSLSSASTVEAKIKR